MKNAFLPLALCLIGTASALSPLAATPAQAFDAATGEVLRYRVFWGPFDVGDTELSYVPQAAAFGKTGGYVLQAHVWSRTPLMAMNDLWRSVGQHGAKITKGSKGMFTPQRYEVVQQENSYEANKLMLFSGKKITYTNFKDPSDKAEPLSWNGKTRDPLSTVYAWRWAGQEALETPEETQVVGLKRTFTLKKEAATKTVMVLRGQDVPVWKANLIATSQRKGKEPTQSEWTIWLKDDEDLTPLQIVGKTKFGTFRAQLER